MRKIVRKARVLKASGEIEAYSREKLIFSLIKAGLDEEKAEILVSMLEKDLPDFVSSNHIHERVYELLKIHYPKYALKYALKRAIMRLGPEGFPFEKFFAKLLQKIGYKTETNRILKGRCVYHEIDVIAVKDGVRYMVECKYHNSPGIYTGLKTVLYVHARLQDLSEYFDAGWVATNTKLSKEAIQYARCVDLKLTAWRYPPHESLEVLIEKMKLYPITVLSTLPSQARRLLLSENIVTLEDLRSLDISELRNLTGLSEEQAIKVMEEAALI